MIEISRHQLANGLRVVHNRNAVTGMVAVNLLYKVGARNESHEYTGLAHLVEHLMFGGTAEAPKFDSCLQEAGGESNAWTNSDITNYYDILPADNIETALWLEADRMRGLALSDKAVEVQRSVVQEEFKQRCLNVPYGDSGHLLRKLVYTRHPYRWPVIGKALADIETVPKSVVRAFYDRYYVPDNAILSVVGNIDSDRLFALVEKWFGDIPAAGFIPGALPVEPPQAEPRSAGVERDVPHDMLVKAYRMAARTGEGYEACDLISDILSSGRSSRFFRDIYSRGDLVSSIDASITGDADPGMFIIKAQLLPGVEYEAVERAIARETDRLSAEGVTLRELEKNMNRFESNMLFSNLNNDERAANLAYYEMLGDACMINREVEKYRSVTPDSIRSAAAGLFDSRNCSTLYYRSSRRVLE